MQFKHEGGGLFWSYVRFAANEMVTSLEYSAWSVRYVRRNSNAWRSLQGFDFFSGASGWRDSGTNFL